MIQAPPFFFQQCQFDLFQNGADIVCLGMYDFQMVADVNLAVEVLNSNLQRERAWVSGRAAG